MKRTPVWIAGTVKAWMKIPKYVRIYDNGGPDVPGGTIDRYMVVYTGRYRGKDGWFQHVGMSGAPYHPQGFCQHGESQEQLDTLKGWAPAMGRRCHLGKRIPFEDLPKDCQRVVKMDYQSLWS
jgi:hypothetical protein